MFTLDAVDVTAQPPAGLRLGFDLVEVGQVAESIERFGGAYERRLFTAAELDHAAAPDGVRAERLAARFAAKEAVIKALNLSDAGIGWREIEVRKQQDGSCELQLHGRVAALARRAGIGRLLLSMSHDGGYAGAVVMALPAQAGDDMRGVAP